MPTIRMPNPKRARSMGLALLLVVTGAVAYFLFKSWTPPIFSGNAVAELTSIDVNEDRQFLLIRGRDRGNPLLLFLHGGPGMPAMYLAHAFQREWEDHFVVVHWDQRASGKSYQKESDPDRIRTSQLIADAEAVVEYLRGRFPEQPIYLLGHSHGSYLGALLASRHPDWFAAYVGVGQVADEARTRDLQDAYLRPLLPDYGHAPDAELTEGLREELLFRTGSELHGETSFAPLLITGLLAPEYSFFDAMKVAQGSSFSSTHMKRDLIDGPLMSSARTFELPVYFIMGARDMVTPVALARQYFDSIEAPGKAFYLIEQAAHFPFFEQPGRVLEILERIASAHPTDAERPRGAQADSRTPSRARVPGHPDARHGQLRRAAGGLHQLPNRHRPPRRAQSAYLVQRSTAGGNAKQPVAGRRSGFSLH